MVKTRRLSVTLPIEMAALVKSKVASGEYASQSEVIHDGLLRLMAQDDLVENWLQDTVGPAFDTLKADPSRAVTIDKVRARLAAEHKKASKM
jgi:antitoxin ParD1/3/4